MFVSQFGLNLQVAVSIQIVDRRILGMFDANRIIDFFAFGDKSCCHIASSLLPLSLVAYSSPYIAIRNKKFNLSVSQTNVSLPYLLN